MKRLFILLGCIGMLTTLSCKNTSSNSNTTEEEQQEEPQELVVVHEMMSGEFSSAAQAAADSLFYDINLVMYPIWESNEEAKWLYVEQAVTASIDKPYRQRVYRLSVTDDNKIESRVYELNDPAKYVHGWDTPEIFNEISPDSLVQREGCSVFLTKQDDCYAGATNAKDCKSTLRGAAYATSKVTVCENQIVSWDQGWNDSDEQVWGAETKGYIFDRKD